MDFHFGTRQDVCSGRDKVQTSRAGIQRAGKSPFFLIHGRICNLMLEVADALAEVLARVEPRKPEECPLSSAVLGRVLAADVLADRDSPPFPKSLRDGYAVRAADCALPNVQLRIVAEIAAGAVPVKPVGPGECARIFTGAPIPDGANAIVMQEDTQPLDGELVQIVDAAVKPGQYIFARGTEMRAGDVVLETGTVLNPASLGVLAGLGKTSATLFPAPRVAILSTGDELVEAGEPLKPGQIRNSNGPMLVAQTVAAGAEPSYLGIARDDAAKVRAMIGEGLASSDVLVIAGGVSVGKFDLVPKVLEDFGVAIRVRQVRMKPGKPLLFGTHGKTLVFGLPGNPVSAFVGFALFVQTALRKLAGHANPHPRTTSLPLAEGIAVSNDRPTYHPARLELGGAGWLVQPLPWLGAPDLRGLLSADALLVLPPGETRLDRGQQASVVILG
jgi:molybdopterin molybdotransferase